MKWIVATLVLLFAVTLVAQQNDMSTALPMSNADVQHEIQSTVSTAPEFNGTNISTQVSDNSVILTGYVVSEQERQQALGFAASVAGDREVVDRIQVGGASSSD